jgi:hypothetical protein
MSRLPPHIQTVGQLLAYFDAEAARASAPTRPVADPLQAVNPQAVPAYVGNLSRDDANRRLAGRPAGSYLFRVSSSQPNAIVLSVVRDRGDVEHLLMQLLPHNASQTALNCQIQSHYDPNTRGICLGNGLIFPTLAEVVRMFPHIARFPVTAAAASAPPPPPPAAAPSRLSILSNPAFWPTLTPAQALDLVRGKPAGTYVLLYGLDAGTLSICYSSPSSPHGMTQLLPRVVPHAPNYSCPGGHAERNGVCLNGRVFPTFEDVIATLTVENVLTTPILYQSLSGGKRRAAPRRRQRSRSVSRRRRSNTRKSKQSKRRKSKRSRR